MVQINPIIYQFVWTIFVCWHFGPIQIFFFCKQLNHAGNNYIIKFHRFNIRNLYILCTKHTFYYKFLLPQLLESIFFIILQIHLYLNIIFMITNYNYHYPYFITYIIPQTQFYVQSFQQNTGKLFSNLYNLSETNNSQIYYKPQQTQLFLEQFISNKPNFNKNQADISYLQLCDKVFVKEVPNLQNFKEIYNRGIERYKSSYKQNERKLSWGKDDVIILLWILDKYCKIYNKIPKNFGNEDWNYIAKLIPFRTADDCMFKYFEMQRIPLSKNPWTKQQDSYLYSIVDKLDASFSWATVSQKLYKRFPQSFRTAKQCRQHYNLLKTAQFNRAKTLWTSSQDLQLIKLYQKQGRRWKNISRLLIGRSENAIKNRFTLLMCRYGKKSQEDPRNSNIIEMIREKIIEEEKTKLDQKQTLMKRLEIMEKQDLEMEQNKFFSE